MVAYSHSHTFSQALRARPPRILPRLSMIEPPAESEDTPPHIPVLLAEVIAQLQPAVTGPRSILIDGTFGAGGYSRALLDATAAHVIAFDRDPAVEEHADALAADYGPRFTFLAGRFGDMAAKLAEIGVEQVAGIVLDLGVSSMQIDQGPRGFSFRADGPLDMRMGEAETDAWRLINTATERELADIIHHYGEERRARAVARAIVAARAEHPIETTGQLAFIIRRVVRPSADGLDPATRSFQALRIAVNDELGELDRALAQAPSLLAPGGRLTVVSYHSLEDRLVKQRLRALSDQAPAPSRHMPAIGTETGEAQMSLITRRPITPTDAEIRRNPRAASARLRTAEKLGESSTAAEDT